MEYDYLLIDGKNALYRAIYANSQNNKHNLTVMLNFIGRWVKRFNPKHVHIYWDCKRDNIWRRQISETYKTRESSREDVSDAVANCMEIVPELLKNLGICQFKRKGMEADDLIYSACRILSPSSVVVASSDSDYHQMPYSFGHVSLYDPMQDTFIPKAEYNPVIKKALMGDKTDSVDGYDGIGKVKAERMARDPIARANFLNVAGSTMFIRNMLLVDLGLCPELAINDSYVYKNLIQDVKLDNTTVNKLAISHKIGGLVSESHNTIYPFKNLLNNQIGDSNGS